MLWHLVIILFIFEKPHEINGNIGSAMPMKKLRRNLILIKEDCGDVCDTSDNFSKVPGIYFDRIENSPKTFFLETKLLLDAALNILPLQTEKKTGGV